MSWEEVGGGVGVSVQYVNEGVITNVLSACLFTLTFVADLLIHIRQKGKIALKIMYNYLCIFTQVTLLSSYNNIFHVRRKILVDKRSVKNNKSRKSLGLFEKLVHHFSFMTFIISFRD
jgi:hypothetical protein